MAEDALRFGSPKEFAAAISGSDQRVAEHLKREMFVKIGDGFYKWVGSVCPHSREHHYVIRGPAGQCYCPHCLGIIEPEWF